MNRRVAAVVRVAGALSLLFPCLGTSSHSQEAIDKELARYRKELVSYFKQFYLLPIIVPEGQRVGDVYSSDFWTLEDKSAKCFPNLAVPKPKPSALPIIGLSTSAHGGFVFGLRQLLNFQTNGNFDSVIKLFFSDVTVSVASKGDLRGAVSATCAYLAPIIDERTLGKEALQLKVILGRVLYARKSVFIGFESAANTALDAPKNLVDLLTSALPDWIAGIPDAQASARLGLGSQRGVIAETKESLPIAFAPAFLPKPIFQGFNLDESNSQPKAFSWEEFDPLRNKDQRELFNNIADAISQ